MKGIPSKEEIKVEQRMLSGNTYYITKNESTFFLYILEGDTAKKIGTLLILMKLLLNTIEKQKKAQQRKNPQKKLQRITPKPNPKKNYKNYKEKECC